MQFDHDVDVTSVQQFLDEDLTWVLEIFAGADVVPAGLWPEDGTSGLLSDYGRPLMKPPRRQLRSAAFERYMSAGVPAWNNLSPSDRMTVRVATSALKAARGAHLEMSIIATGSMLELLAAEWLTTATQSQFSLPTATKNAIKGDIRTSVAAHAAGSAFRGQLNVLFWLPLSGAGPERFEQLFTHLGLAWDASELANFVRCRNDVAHTSSNAPTRDEKVRAMLFGYAMVARCLLVRLGYHGNVYDERSQQDIVIWPPALRRGHSEGVRSVGLSTPAGTGQHCPHWCKWTGPTADQSPSQHDGELDWCGEVEIDVGDPGAISEFGNGVGGLLGQTFAVVESGSDV